ncbi:MAG: TetR/AcrR family transcriptional regulator [Verrucomicrobiales bacterium]|nr:TetR/AcrR family transcriptional regulator [Verrucomicrobiales bacterium]MCP5527750.1 TetR/AcrR family transcriptional regulator [Verrucomicrobiales bacterium]
MNSAEQETLATRDRLIESAFQLFARKGFRRVNLDQIAAAAGVTKGSLYWHFRSKQEIITAASAFYYRTYQRRMNAAVAPARDAWDRLRRALRFAVRTCLLDQDNRVFTTEIFTHAVHHEETRTAWRQFYDSVREFYLGLVQAAVLAGQLAPANPEDAVNTMLAAMEGIKLRALFEPELCSSREEGRMLESLLAVLIPVHATATPS